METHKTIGTSGKQLYPRLIIVDGQQRLTSLYAVIKGGKITRENYSKKNIKISFNPHEAKFEIPDNVFEQANWAKSKSLLLLQQAFTM